MQEYTRLEMDERELEDAIRQAPHLIEDGLRFVDHQRRTSRGPLDVLLVDREGILVVGELKVKEDDGMLMQGIDYYDYIFTNLSSIASIYGSYNIEADSQPRLLLVAPSFSPLLLNRCKWITEDLTISLYTYQKIGLQGAATVVYSPIEFPTRQAPPDKSPKLDELIAQIGNSISEQMAREFFATLETWEPRPQLDMKPRFVSLKVRNRVFGRWAPRKTGFQRCDTHDADDEWRGFTIKDKDDMTEFVKVLRANFERKSVKPSKS